MATFNFSTLQQKADQVLKNSDEAIRKWVDLALAPAKDVPIEYYDPNGNLVQTTVPNRAKLFNDLLVNVNSAMSRTYYVDATTGDDNNDGSQTAPFATLKKAIDSVPVGGVGIILLMSDVNINTIVDIDKFIYIGSYNTSASPIPNTTDTKLIFEDDGTALTGVIILRNGALVVGGWNRGLVIQVGSSGTKVSGKAIVSGDKFADGTGTLLNMFDIAHSYIENNADAVVALQNVRSRYTKYVRKQTGSFYISIPGFCSLLDSQTILEDSAGNAITWVDAIAGIVRDTNGTPRNVLSNIVL